MKAPFGKRKKTPGDNADCFLKSVEETLKSHEEGKSNKKIEKKSVKYITRMKEIVDGKYEKWPNTLVRMLFLTF